MKVTLRQRKKSNKISLYLDYYESGKRQYEYLDLYLTPEPEKGTLSAEEKKENKKNLAFAEAIQAKRLVEIQNNIYGFENKAKLAASFINYVEYLAKQKKSSKGNYDNWDSALKHLRKFARNDIRFREIDKKWLESFKEYLDHNAKTSANKHLSENTKISYFNKIRAALKKAVADGIILKNPSLEVQGFHVVEAERKFLTLDELQSLAKTECDVPVLKQAFIFSALTGLRWSDINKLTWSEVQYSTEMSNYIRFRQQKTKEAETLPISSEAFSLLGARGRPEERVFVGLKYSSWFNLRLQQWALDAKITKRITFHSARHTFATLQLTFDTDLYTVSKLLGHRNIKTTQIYAKIIDKKKSEAVNKIKLF